MRARFRRLNIGFVVVGLVAATLGLSATSSVASVGAAAKDSVITIGTICSCSGQGAGTVNTDSPVMKAWVANINAKGGINGHKFKLIIKDDAGDATKGAVAVDELKRAGAVAIVNETSLVDVDWAKDAEKAGLPVIGGSAVRLGYLLSPLFFASATNIFAAVYGDLALAKTKGPNLAVLPCTEAPTCAQAVGIYKAFGTPLGVKVVYSQSFAASTPDFTAICLALKDSGAQSYVIVGAIQRLSDACVQQGVKATLVESSGVLVPELLKSKGAEGLLAADVNVPFVINNTPATKEFHTVVDKYAASVKNQPSANVPWAAMQLFGAAVKGVGTGAVTSESLENALYAMKDETLGGLSQPMNFVKGEVHLHDCWFVTGVKKGKYVAPQGAKVSCAPPSAVDPLAKTVAASLAKK
jgi:branched-chain amino acid transport system substrate-binding protein